MKTRNHDGPNPPIPRTTLTPEQAEARNLIPHLLDAGFELLDDRHDDYIVVRDPGSGIAVFLTDQRGGRLEFRCYLTGRRSDVTDDGGSTDELMATAVRALNDDLWGLFLVDRDRDVVIRYHYLRGGGVLLGNLTHAIRQFASLCDYARRRLKEMGALEREDDDDPPATTDEPGVREGTPPDAE